MDNLYKVVTSVESDNWAWSRDYIRVIKSPIEITLEEVEWIVAKDACYKVEHWDSAVINSFEEITKDVLDEMELTESFVSFALNIDWTKNYMSREAYNVA